MHWNLKYNQISANRRDTAVVDKRKSKIKYVLEFGQSPLYNRS